MTNPEELAREVRAAIDEALKVGPVRTDWLQQQIVHSHIELGHIPHDWTLCVVNLGVRNVILRVMRELRKVDEEGDNERQQSFAFDAVLPGFKRLRASCLVQRDGESMIVRTLDATYDELKAKAREHRKQGMGHLEKADEYDRLAESLTESRPRA